MAVLFDSFSYRIKEVESGICYDRWHFGKYPELTMPEHLYYLNRVINCLLTHDKIIIRTDSLDKKIFGIFWENDGIFSFSKLTANPPTAGRISPVTETSPHLNHFSACEDELPPKRIRSSSFIL